MKRSGFCLLLIVILQTYGCAQRETLLLVRGDDIGSSHNANLACIESYKNGIERSVEIMVPCSWFEEAVILLNENPGLDVGIHLCLTSEWDNYKWRPLTHAPSITDQDGYFFPMIWPGENYPENRTLKYSSFDIKEVEKELRAQIELAMRKIPRISHLSEHMGWTSISPEMKDLYEKLAIEYHLETDYSSLKHTGGYDQKNPQKTAVQGFIEMLNGLKPGTYLFVEHPGLNTPEAQGIFHTGNETVAADRQLVTDIFTSPDVMKAVADNKIRLISYYDLKK
jgi:chitin disaccharide deacetylase